MDMKKIYIAPEIETIDCMPASAILDGSLEVVTKEQIQDGEGVEAVGESRGDWDNIWNN